VRPIDRRELLRLGALAGLGLGALPLTGGAAAEPESPRVRRRVRVGRTGLEAPDVGFGSSRLRGDEDVVRHALDRGITWFDTAESYTGGEAERTLGRALRDVRQRVVLVSKVEAGERDGVAHLMGRLEASLARLQTDRIDVYLNHAVNDPARMANPAWGEFTERAREQGKIRFRGMSGHGGRLVESLDFALDHDLVDLILVAHNFGQDPAFYERFTRELDFVAVQTDLPRALAKAKQKDVGVVAMKTLRGARLNDMRAYEAGGATFAQAALRWTLSNPNVDSLVVTMTSREQIDEYLGASGGTRPAAGDASLLLAYERRNRRAICQPGCGACAGACPAGVPIADVLRARMYAVDYGDAALAREAWATLGASAAACAGCTARPCLGACPNGIPIAELTANAQRRLG
jgi:predicted aldo/keto reductase-like oxidoreductase